MRERLLDLIYDVVELYPSEYEKLADHLLDNGVIAPPVRVGQTVWCLIGSLNHAVEGRLYECNIRYDGITYFRFSRNGYFSGIATEDAIGKTVFLTRDAAEAALKARENNAD